MDESYRWDEDTYRAIAANGVAWQAVSYVLRHAHPRYRQHIGALMRVAAHAPDGSLIGVTLIEESDDQYLVITARHLEGAERETVEKLLNRGGA